MTKTVRQGDQKTATLSFWDVLQGLGSSLSDMRALTSQHRHWWRPVKISKRRRFVIMHYPCHVLLLLNVETEEN